MTTLLTGATGFVGSAVLRRLVDAGHSVRVLTRQGSDRRNIEDVECEVAIGDLNERDSLHVAVRGCSALFHVAADYRLWTPNPSELYRTNETGTRNLLRAAADAGVTRMVYTSSVATLGVLPGGLPADEETPVTFDDMIGHYKRSKFVAEAAVAQLVREEKLPVVTVNPSAPVGPRDVKPTPTGRMIVDASTGRMPAYVNTGLNIVHVDDVAEGHMLAFDKGTVGDRYILGGENLSLQEILTRIAGICDRPPPRVRLPRAPIYPIAYVAEAIARMTRGGEPMVTVDSLRMSKKLMYFSSAKAERLLGYRARPAEVAFRDAIEWFRANGYFCR